MINSRFLNYVHYARQRADIKENMATFLLLPAQSAAHDFFIFTQTLP